MSSLAQLIPQLMSTVESGKKEKKAEVPKTKAEKFDAKMEERREKIIELLGGNRFGLTIAELVDKTGLTKCIIRKALLSMEDQVAPCGVKRGVANRPGVIYKLKG